MAILTPVKSKFTLTKGTVQELYSCPADKSHAVLDASFFRNLITDDTFVEIALTTKTSPAQLTSLDFFLDDIEMSGSVNFVELSKFIVGPGEKVYARVWEGDDVNIRITGMEETNPRVLQAGRLGAQYGPANESVVVYTADTPGTSYVSCSVTIYNPDEDESAEVEMWITSNNTPTDVDKILRFNLTPEDSSILENVILHPGEKIILRSDIENSEYFINGTVVGTV